jgi:cell division protein FtsA
MVGQTLTGQFHGVWMNKNRFKTLSACLKRCQVSVQNLIFSGYSSALSCLSADEQELGTMLIDWGGSTTSASFFFKGQFVDHISVPCGGHQITQDIAIAFGTSIAQAERLKILHGAALLTQNDHHEIVSVEPGKEWDGDFPSNIPRSALIRLVQLRSEEILKILKKQIDACPYASSVQRIVLTGGGGQLPSLRELVQRFLNRSVRLARPIALENAPRHSTDLSSVIGAMLHHSAPLDPFLALPKKDFNFFSWLRKKM